MIGLDQQRQTLSEHYQRCEMAIYGELPDVQLSGLGISMVVWAIIAAILAAIGWIVFSVIVVSSVTDSDGATNIAILLGFIIGPITGI